MQTGQKRFVPHILDISRMSEHPLTHNDRMALDPQRKIVAKMARTTFTNVYEPPIDDACVKIDILQKELNIEQIMDNVTSAMSIDALMNEVGEKKAFRQRLLIHSAETPAPLR